MKACLVVVLAFCAVALAADDEKCKNDFKTFLTCVKTQYDQKPESEKEAAKKERQDKSNKCFADAGCDAPDWNKDPMGGAGKKGFGGMQMSPAVKECLKKKMIEKIGNKLNECLTKKGVQKVDFADLADSMKGSQVFEAHGGAGKDGIHGAIAAKFNIVKAVDKCAQKKGGDTDSVKPLEQCLHNIKKDDKPKICAFLKPCEDKLTGECKKRGQEIMKALCQCKKEKEKEISKKLIDLGHQNKKVPIQDLIKTAVDDQDMNDIAKQIDACYEEAHETPNPLLQLAIKMFTGSGGSPGGAGAKFGAAMSVNGSSVVIAGDMMALDADDPSECEPCK